MSLGDKGTRQKAIFFQSHPFSAEAHADPQIDYDGVVLLRDPTATDTPTKALAMTLPFFGDAVELYIFMQMTAPSDIELNVRIGIGTFVGDGVPDVDDLTQEPPYYTAVASSHRRITGVEEPFNAAVDTQLTVEENLLTELPRRGDANYNNDGFVLVVNFDDLPDPANGYSLDKFLVYGSMQMGLI